MLKESRIFMMIDFVDCPICGGRREHDLRTGEILSCDTCPETLEVEREGPKRDQEAACVSGNQFYQPSHGQK